MALQRLVLSLALLSPAVHASENQYRGLSPQLQQKLHAVSSFYCDNRDQELPLSRLNDNYCDCKDGSDEPGTSACSHTRAVFHCVNAGFFSLELPTSRVNDGVCDCCDGSDEYASGASCGSQCSKEMQSFMAGKKELMQQVDAGLEDRAVLAAEVRKLWSDEELKARQLAAQVATLRVAVKQLEAKKEQEERVEQTEKERRVGEKREAIVGQLGLLQLTREQLVAIILEVGREGVAKKPDLLPMIRKTREAAIGADGEVPKTLLEAQDEAFRERDEARQEETRRIEKLIEERAKSKEKDEVAAAEGGDSVSESSTDKLADDEEEELPDADELELPEVETHPIDLLYEELAAVERYESSEAVVARTEHENAKKKVEEEERKLLEALKLLQKDFGVDRLFFGLRGKCVESSVGQYTYKICFFGKATQDQTILGDMDDLKGLEVQDSDDLSVAHEGSSTAGTIVKQLTFSNGQKCWNGPTRSLTVTLVCGPEPMELFDIEEPSTCVYSAKLRTPVVCSEDDRKRILTFDNAQVAPHYIEMEVLPTL